jgi:hypothetical protein
MANHNPRILATRKPTMPSTGNPKSSGPLSVCIIMDESITKAVFNKNLDYLTQPVYVLNLLCDIS